MSMFPGPGAQVYYNDAGEPLGWDYPSNEPPDFDDHDSPDFCKTCGEPWDGDDCACDERPVKDDDADGLANDVEHFYARNAEHLDPNERALLANTVKLIRRFT